MEQKSIVQVAAFAIRFVALLAIFIGLILTTQTIFQLIAAHSALSGDLPPGMSINIKGAAGRIGIWAIAGNLFIMIWGFLLAICARPLANAIGQE
jgi:hypothetical protein